jgi:hypothetical protein
MKYPKLIQDEGATQKTIYIALLHEQEINRYT